MPKITDEELKEWLNTPGSMQLIKSDKHNSDVLVKIPYKQDFDLLFCSHVWNADNLKLNEKLEIAGLYYRKDGCIYNSSYSFRSCCEDTDIIIEYSHKEDFAKKLTELVKAKVEEIIDNKRSNLTIKELTDGYLLNQMQYYSEYGAARDAKKAFIKGDEVSDIVYKCPYSVDSMSDADYIQFIVDKEPLIEREANEYIEKHQENMLAQFYNNTLLRKELKALYDDPDNILHRVKAIIDAVKESGAKTVNVNINKEDKEFTFKYETRTLTVAPDSYYSSYNMKASDRREFENLFGRNANFYPSEITQITYGRNVIYDASEFDMTETEDSIMEQTM